MKTLQGGRDVELQRLRRLVSCSGSGMSSSSSSSFTDSFLRGYGPQLVPAPELELLLLLVTPTGGAQRPHPEIVKKEESLQINQRNEFRHEGTRFEFLVVVWIYPPGGG
ncbi:hypothetical protein AAFF_G00035020 [Aldrovandia affinis]|uniref:Uncharacterized protein n=1 Tax=Aldrovandia affinis TaxID=143900 RepID=A0AAD7S3N4_9TELE|nr:hypothetical protein AAFF_G00035020 [Aldrovandia affinis]